MATKLFDTKFVGTAEEALDLMDDVLESSTEFSIIGKDLDGKILLWNEGARRLYGYEPEEVVGKADSAMLHVPEDVAAGGPREMREAAIREGKWEGTIGRVRKNGRRFTARVVMTPRRDPAGRAVGFLLISKDISEEIRLTEAAARDVTERKRFEKALQEKNLELENASLGKDRFLAGMSHELRTPLNAIIGFTGTLLMRLPGELNKDQEGQLTIIESSATHLLSLLNDLLDLAKIEAGKVELKSELVPCTSVVSEVVASLRPFAAGKGLMLGSRLPKEEILCRTDRRALTQILLNLTNNAIKFTEKGSVRIDLARARGNGGTATDFTVNDTGIGIRPEDQARLFQPFEQVSAPKKRQQGTGLGLHLCRKLAGLLGGQILLTSEFGKGSAFTLTLGES